MTKWALREVGRPLLPPQILQRGKQGFGVPLEHWFGGDFGRLAREVLLDRRCRDRGWLDPRGVERVLAGVRACATRSGRGRCSRCVCLELWAQTWLDRPRQALCEPDRRTAAAARGGRDTAKG